MLVNRRERKQELQLIKHILDTMPFENISIIPTINDILDKELALVDGNELSLLMLESHSDYEIAQFLFSENNQLMVKPVTNKFITIALHLIKENSLDILELYEYTRMVQMAYDNNYYYKLLRLIREFYNCE
jgi:hypothetical protein